MPADNNPIEQLKQGWIDGRDGVLDRRDRSTASVALTFVHGVRAWRPTKRIISAGTSTSTGPRMTSTRPFDSTLPTWKIYHPARRVRS